MNGAAISALLAKAEEAVADGERHLSRQRRLIDELQRDGHDTAAARVLLATFEQSQALHIVDRDRLRRDLARALSGEPF